MIFTTTAPERIKKDMEHRRTFSRTRSWKDRGKSKCQFRGKREALKFEC